MKNIFFALLIFISVKLLSQNQGQGQNRGTWPGSANVPAGMAEKMKIGHFYGKIVDSTNNKGVEFASVQLIGSVFDTVTKSMKKDVVVAGQLTLENGDFSLEKINLMGKYMLKISAMGYSMKEIPVSFDIDMEKMKNGGGMGMLSSADKDLGNIKLKPQATQLKEVTVEATTPVMELKLDKKVFNVGKNMVATGGTAEDVLKQVPSVSVDMDGNVTMRNATPQIFVDGKLSTLTIDQIPADIIESVELITNPSAKYDASGGQGGILNIILKKDKRIGYNGNIRLGVDQRGKINTGGDLNAREGKINAFISGNLNQRHSLSTGETYRENLISNPLTHIFQDNNSINDGMFLNSRGGIDWFMDNRNTLTIAGNFVRGRFSPTDELNTQTDTVYSSYIHSSQYRRNAVTSRNFHNAGGSVQYKHLFPKDGEEITGDINYNKIFFTSDANYATQYYDGNNTQTGSALLQTTNGSGSTEIISSQMDYKHPFNAKSKLETGVKGTYRGFTSAVKNFLKNDSTGEFTLVKNQNSNYAYVDQVYAAYATYSRQMNKFSYQAGLRAESSFYTGELVDSNKTFKIYYPISLFPSFSTTYDLNGKDNFQFSYSRRINRPSFFQILPYTDYSDSLNLRKGNPGLKPEFTHSLELSYLKTIDRGNSILLSAYFKNSTDLITSYQRNEYDTVLHHSAVISTFENANSSHIYGGELTSKHAIKKWLEFTLNINGYYAILDAKNIESNLSSERFSWFTKGNFTIKFPKNISLQISAQYRSKISVPVNNNEGRQGGFGNGPTATAQGYIQPNYSMDAALRYEFLKNKAASISIGIRDIFATDIDQSVSNSDYFNQTSSRIRDPHFVRVNFAYRFGKFDASLFKRKNTKVNTEGMDVGM